MAEVKVLKNLTKNFQLIESIKTLRTNLMFTGDENRAVGITSFNKNEGKSTISLYLAASLAKNDKKVVLLETDLRGGILQKTLHVHQKIEGLSHYLSNQGKLENIIYKTDVENLDIIFSGKRVSSSSELLGSEHFVELINILKSNYDYVIVDSAPLGQVVDCAVIAPKLDGVIMVIDAGNNSYKLEQKVKNQLEMAGAKILGVVLNRVDFKHNKAYYGKKYYYYGYGEEKGNKN